jgi:hypothetical protein
MTFILPETDALVGATCIECGQAFRAGDLVERVPGSTSRHAECPDEYEWSEHC